MSYLYVNENGAVIGIEGSRCYVNYKNGLKQTIPIETLDGITILGQVQMTTQCTKECMSRGITVSYFSKGGHYFGRLVSTGHVNAARQRKQSILYDTDFSLQLAKRILSAKVRNQLVVMKRYGKSRYIDLKDEERLLLVCEKKIHQSKSINEILGHEGQAAKHYFQGLSKCIIPEFCFSGRSKRPPKDEFNSMISLGYSILMNEIYDKIEVKGMNPYFGFIHRDAENHPTLASDLMEEWRAIIVDATVMSMINGHEISKEQFLFDLDEPGCYLTKEALRLFLNKLERKLQTDIKYLKYVDYSVSFRRAIFLQCERLVKAIEEGDAEIYEPIVIR